MDGESTPSPEAFEEELGYRFADRSLLQRAMTHSSRRNDLKDSNERLEFLGDAILGLVVSERLYRELPEHSEGELTRVKSVVVSRSTLAKVARRLQFADSLIIGKGLAQRKIVPSSLLANAFEAVLAAIYLDGGMEKAREFALRCLGEPIDHVLHNRYDLNYKSILQQYAQRELSATPTYQVAREEGPDHVKSFTVVAVLDGRECGVGVGSTKKDAEQMAAAETLRLLRVDPAAP